MFNGILDYQNKAKLNNLVSTLPKYRGFGTVHYSLLLTTVPIKSSIVCYEDFYGKLFYNKSHKCPISAQMLDILLKISI